MKNFNNSKNDMEKNKDAGNKQLLSLFIHIAIISPLILLPCCYFLGAGWGGFCWGVIFFSICDFTKVLDPWTPEKYR